MNYKITSDSTCDLSCEQAERYSIGILPLYVQLGDRTYQDGVDIFPDDIYQHVTAGGALATTAAVNLSDYVRAFSALSRKYDFVIHICISPDFPAAIRMRALRGRVSKTSTSSTRAISPPDTGLSFSRRSGARKKAWSRAHCRAFARKHRHGVDASFILSRLDYMQKGGRCSSVAVLGANLIKAPPGN